MAWSDPNPTAVGMRNGSVRVSGLDWAEHLASELARPDEYRLRSGETFWGILGHKMGHDVTFWGMKWGIMGHFGARFVTFGASFWSLFAPPDHTIRPSIPIYSNPPRIPFTGHPANSCQITNWT